MNDDLLNQDESKHIKGGMDRRKGDSATHDKLDGIQKCLSNINIRLNTIEGLCRLFEESRQSIDSLKLTFAENKNHCPYEQTIIELKTQADKLSGSLTAWKYLPIIIQLVISAVTIIYILMEKGK